MTRLLRWWEHLSATERDHAVIIVGWLCVLIALVLMPGGGK